MADVAVSLPAGPPVLNHEAAAELLALLLDAYAELIAQDQAETKTKTAA